MGQGLKKSIVLIGNTSFTRTALKVALVNKGFDVFEFSEGAKILQANKFNSSLEAVGLLDHITPDLIVLDLDVEDINGFVVLKKIKSHPDFSDVPIIVNSAYGKKELIINAVTFGAADYVLRQDKFAKNLLSKINSFFTNTLGDFEPTLRRELEWIKFGKKELAFALVVITHKGNEEPVDQETFDAVSAKLKQRVRHYDWVFPVDERSIGMILPLTTIQDLIILRRRMLEHFKHVGAELVTPIKVQIGFSHYPSNAKSSEELIQVAKDNTK